MRIYLNDNNIGQSNVKTYNRNDVSALFPIADKTIGQLCRENEHLLIFPYCIEDSDDRIGESSVLSIINTDNSDRVKISTGETIAGFRKRLRAYCKGKLETYKIPQKVVLVDEMMTGARFKKMRKE